MPRIESNTIFLQRGRNTLFWLDALHKKSSTKEAAQQFKHEPLGSVSTLSGSVVLSNVQGNERENKLTALRSLLGDLYVLEKLKDIALWDLTTYLPKNAYESRAQVLENADKLYHERLVTADTEELLSYFENESNKEGLTEVERALIKVLRDEYKRYKNVPVDLIQQIRNLETKSVEMLNDARKTNDFNKVVPVLEKIFSLKGAEAKFIGYKNSPYDVLLNDYEPGMTTKEMDEIVDLVKKELIPMVKAIRGTDVEIETRFLGKSYKPEKLMELSKDLLRHIGFDLDSGRLDPSPDPYSTYLGDKDVRLTTRVKKGDLYEAISYALHEGGHGLYAQGYDVTIKSTLLADSPSIALDESQSILYETFIGYGKPFWIYYLPLLKQMFPRQLGNVPLDAFYKAINKIDFLNDDLSSQLRYVIRYEIERDLIEKKLEVKDIPKIWRQKMKQYLGRTQVNAEEEIMEGDHWFTGYIGYYPTYILGAIYAAQIYNTAKKEIDDLEIEIASGNMKVLKTWLREKIWRHGALKDTREVITKTCGEGLNAKHLVNFLRNKYSKIYPILA